MTPKRPQPPFLELRNVTIVRGGRRPALKALDLRLGVGESIAILGPNGSGKSTLLKALTREVYPYPAAGPVIFELLGRPLERRADLRGRIGVVSQEVQEGLRRRLTVLETVLSGYFDSVGLDRRRVLPAQKRHALYLLGRLSIARLASRRMDTLSAGEARRALIARALVHEPQALLLDEPCVGLDPPSAESFRRTLSRIARSGTGLILITHHVEDIVPEIGRVLLIRRGRALLDGPRSRVLTGRNLSRLFGAPVRIRTGPDGRYRSWVAGGRRA